MFRNILLIFATLFAAAVAGCNKPQPAGAVEDVEARLRQLLLEMAEEHPRVAAGALAALQRGDFQHCANELTECRSRNGKEAYRLAWFLETYQASNGFCKKLPPTDPPPK